MSKQPKIFWKSSQNCFYANIQRKQTRLDPDEDRAWEVFYATMADRGVAADPLVADVLRDFLAHHASKSAPRTHEFYKSSIDSFSAWLAENDKRLTISKIKPAHVNKWITDRHAFKLKETEGRKWKPSTEPTSDNYRHNLIRAVKSTMAWYAGEHELERVPLKGLKKPAQTASEVTLPMTSFGASWKPHHAVPSEIF